MVPAQTTTVASISPNLMRILGHRPFIGIAVLTVGWFTFITSLIYRLARRMRRSRAAPIEDDQEHLLSPMERANRCRELAVATLLRNVSDKGVGAGSGVYDDVWMRDAGFSSLGLLKLGELNSVRRLVDNMCSHIRADGLVPLRLSRGSMIVKNFKMLLGLGGAANQDVPYHPTFVDDKAAREPFDSCSMLIVICWRLYEAGGDADFLAAKLPFMTRALGWLEAQATPSDDGGILLHEVPYFIG